MNKDIDEIRDKILRFCEDITSMPDFEVRTKNFLFSEIVNDLNEKRIKNFGEWLIYYSTDGNDFNEVLSVAESYYDKAATQKLDEITLDEQIMIYNAVGLYSLEMDSDQPSGRLLGMVIYTFIEIVRHYSLFIKGYLLLKGDVLISDRTKSQFYSVWSNGSTFKKEMPITLFKVEKI